MLSTLWTTLSGILSFSNYMVCLLWICFAFVTGEFIGKITKAWVPSLLVAALILLFGFWTFVPAETIATSNLAAVGGTVAMYLCLSHMGTIVDFKQLAAQWKVVVICLFGLAGMVAACLCLIPVVGRNYVVSGLPPLTGGIIAMRLMQEAATAKGLTDCAVLALLVMVMQQMVGFPLAAICLKIESRKLLKEYEEKGGVVDAAAAPTDAKALKKASRKPTAAGVFFKLAISTIIALCLGALLNAWIHINLGAVFALLVAMVLTQVGFLDTDSLNKAGSFGFLMFALLAACFASLASATPALIAQVALPLGLILIVGVSGCAVMCFIASKLLKTSFAFAFAMGLNALFGFPPNAILTEETCKAMGKTPEEVSFLRGRLLPSMLVAGFTCVTIASVIIASIFTNLLV